jgi:ribosome-binding protein aMBF1 (putative translation factor)
LSLEYVPNHMRLFRRKPRPYIKWLGVLPDRSQVATLGDVLARGVRAERSRRGWRQSDLAERCQWSMDTVSAIERGARRVDLDDCLRLCRALGLPLVKLLDGASDEDLRSLGLA